VPVLWCWRHPKAQGAAGRCIGRTDLAVDPRKAKRLAHRIRRTARVQGLPRVLWVSTLRRAADVGGWLRRWGWQVHIDARLCEMDFGVWDGRPWADIEWAEVQAWQDDLLHRAPGGGESLWQLAQRVQSFVAEVNLGTAPRLLVTHGGWLNAWLNLPSTCMHIDAARWPAAPRHGSLRVGPARG
jgi:alpha-ribazole phosphatase